MPPFPQLEIILIIPTFLNGYEIQWSCTWTVLTGISVLDLKEKKTSKLFIFVVDSILQSIYWAKSRVTEHEKPGGSFREVWGEAYTQPKGRKVTCNKGHLEARCNDKAVRNRESHWSEQVTNHRAKAQSALPVGSAVLPIPFILS